MKTFIKNAKGKNICLLIEKKKNQRGLVFIAHGLGGFKEQKHITAMAKAFQKLKYTTIRYDARNTIGESEGNDKYATITNYYKDLLDVIKWAKQQSFYEEPFCLVGHSLGSFCVAYYAENHPQKVKYLIPTSAVVSGKLIRESFSTNALKEWKQTGWWIRESHSKPGAIIKLLWRFVEDAQKYNLLKKVKKLVMPTLLIVGSKDKITPYKNQKLLYDNLPGEKKLVTIKNGMHTFRKSKSLSELQRVIIEWVEDNDKS
ncbi:MAG: alpha/beta fold hydrolase [bacterium]